MHAQRVVSIMRRYAEAKSSVALAALAGAREFRAWAHYPQNDVIDTERNTEFYYHAHAGAQRVADEHGHFHVFTRPGGRARFHHLVGISLDCMGMPRALFLTNQWVTGETWASASSMAKPVQRFACEASGRLAPVAQWVTSMVRLYEPEILALHARREAWFDAQRARGALRAEILTNQRHPIVARKSIRLVSRLAQLA